MAARGHAATQITLLRRLVEARVSAAVALKAAGDPQAADMQTLGFCNLRAKAADEVTDDRRVQAASKQLDHTALKTTKRHHVRRRAAVSATK